MKKLASIRNLLILRINQLFIAAVPYVVAANPAFAQSSQLQVSEGALGFRIPTFADIITFVIRAFFVAAGVMALIFLLTGGLFWITSGGDKEKVEKARDRLQAAIVGIILVVVVVALVATLEQVVFQAALCLGLTCPATIPSLLQRR